MRQRALAQRRGAAAAPGLSRCHGAASCCLHTPSNALWAGRVHRGFQTCEVIAKAVGGSAAAHARVNYVEERWCFVIRPAIVRGL